VRRLQAPVLLAQALLVLVLLVLAPLLLVPVQVLPVQVLPVQVLLVPLVLALLLPVQVLLALGPNPPMGRRQEPTGPNCQSKILTSQNKKFACSVIRKGLICDELLFNTFLLT
jgi:hypothetical protein